jgi:HAD superfamily hydrolase (TIGR01509 family)
MHDRDRRAVFFDLDGTLLATNYLHAMAWWQAFDEVGERQPFASIHRLIGMGGSDLIAALLGRPDELIEDGHARHMKALRPMITALPGALDLLRQVKAHNGLVVMVTSAAPDDVPSLLGALGADPFIDFVVDGGDVSQAKPHPDLFAYALDRADLPVRSVMALGDSVWDIEAAGRLGLGCIGVTTGGIDETSLIGAGALAVYASCRELLDEWSRSPLGGLFS